MSNALVMPGYRITEYRLIIPLSEALQQTVMQVRKECTIAIAFPFPLN